MVKQGSESNILEKEVWGARDCKKKKEGQARVGKSYDGAT